MNKLVADRMSGPGDMKTVCTTEMTSLLDGLTIDLPTCLADYVYSYSSKISVMRPSLFASAMECSIGCLLKEDCHKTFYSPSSEDRSEDELFFLTNASRQCSHYRLPIPQEKIHTLFS